MELLQSGLWLPRDVHCVERREHTLLVAENVVLQVDSKAASAVASVVSALHAGSTLRKIVDLVGLERARQILSTLQEHGWLVLEQDCRERGGQFEQVIGWLASCTARPFTIWNRLRRCQVAIVGVGGIGALLAEHLVAAGVGNLVLIDGDRVALTNLNRQYLYDHQSVDRLKVQAARERLSARNPEVKIVVHAHFATQPSDLACLDDEPVDILVNCADQPHDLLAVIEGYCKSRALAFTSAGVGLHRGTWGPLIVPGQTISQASFDSALGGTAPSVAELLGGPRPCRSSFGPYNSIIASFLAADVLLYLGGLAAPETLGRQRMLDFRSLKITTFPAMAPHVRPTRSKQ